MEQNSTDNAPDIRENPEVSQEEKRRKLYDRQVALLKTFLENGAISKQQFDKSYGDLTVKMGYGNKEK